MLNSKRLKTIGSERRKSRSTPSVIMLPFEADLRVANVEYNDRFSDSERRVARNAYFKQNVKFFCHVKYSAYERDAGGYKAKGLAHLQTILSRYVCSHHAKEMYLQFEADGTIETILKSWMYSVKHRSSKCTRCKVLKKTTDHILDYDDVLRLAKRYAEMVHSKQNS